MPAPTSRSPAPPASDRGPAKKPAKLIRAPEHGSGASSGRVNRQFNAPRIVAKPVAPRRPISPADRAARNVVN
ncbi:MAG TPA: hypothetical protein VGM07_17125 [Stellaceae bacterium]